jgi:hypothetical protein
MKSCHLTPCVVLVSFLAFAGCETRPAANPAVTPVAAPLPDTAGSEPATQAAGRPTASKSPFAGDEGYWHPDSEVGFLYPAGWTKLGVRQSGPVTSLGLLKEEGDISVTLYWSEPEEAIDEETIGEKEWTDLKPLYGDKVGSPQRISVRKKLGYRLPIDSGPLGKKESGRKGVVYVFAVKSKGKSWKIKLRATVSTPEQFTEVGNLLDNYRWPEN